MAETLAGFTAYRADKGEEYMNDRQKNHFRVILLAWKQELMEEGRRAVSSMQDEPLNLPDPNDRASQEEEFTINLRARDRERKLLRKIDKALGRLASDDYGYCEGCGVEIGLRRLEARPTAELCIDCKHLEEEKEKSQAA
ncbi:MAG: RNA polymerase-binding protein DksA [Candidatus Competibacter sp.]